MPQGHNNFCTVDGCFDRQGRSDQNRSTGVRPSRTITLAVKTHACCSVTSPRNSAKHNMKTQCVLQDARFHFSQLSLPDILSHLPIVYIVQNWYHAQIITVVIALIQRNHHCRAPCSEKASSLVHLCEKRSAVASKSWFGEFNTWVPSRCQVSVFSVLAGCSVR